MIVFILFSFTAIQTKKNPTKPPKWAVFSANTNGLTVSVCPEETAMKGYGTGKGPKEPRA